MLFCTILGGVILAVLLIVLRSNSLARKQMRDRLQVIADSTHDGIAMMDDKGSISFWNPALEHMLGYTAAEAIGKDLHMLLAPERYHAAYQQNIQEFHRSGCGNVVGKTLELSAKKKDGKEILIDLSLSAMQIDGLWHAVGIVRDITARVKSDQEKKQMQIQLFHAEKLASIGTMAAGIAHEINNPLAIVKGFTSILAKKLKTLAPAEDEEKNFAIMNTAINRIVTIVGSLRTFARIDTDHEEDVDINTAMAEIIPFFENITKNAGIVIQHHLTQNLPLVRGNIGKIQQVLINLLTNASDALQSRHGDRRIVVETLADEKSVIIRVSDNGPGIAADILDKIFDPFFTTKPIGKGTGLGLSISRSIVESFGGTIEVSSPPSGGCIFQMTLPMMDSQVFSSAEENATLKMASVGQRHRGEVLIVDDEPGLLMLFKSYLDNTGLGVTTMVDPHEAVAVMGRKSFDVIVTDLKMPHMSGITLLKQARTLERQAGAKFMVITGNLAVSETSEDREFLQKNVHGSLVKPFDEEPFVALIVSLLPHTA